MKKYTVCLLVAMISVFGCVSSAFADLGLAQLAAGPAVGQAVLTAAKAVYAENTDPAVIQQQLVAILNEAAATGNESSIRYALVAVMMAGGPDAFSQSVEAINNSNCFNQYPGLTGNVVGTVASLMGIDLSGGAPQAGGDQQGGGDNNTFLKALGLDPNNPFSWGSLTGPGDGDVDATPR